MCKSRWGGVGVKLSATDEKTEKKIPGEFFFSFFIYHSLEKILWVLQFLFNSPTHSITETDKFRVNFRINIYGNIYDIDFYSIERIFIRTEMLC